MFNNFYKYDSCESYVNMNNNKKWIFKWILKNQAHRI